MTNVPTRYAHTILETADDLKAYVTGENTIRQALTALATVYPSRLPGHSSAGMQIGVMAITSWISHYNALYDLGLLSGPYTDKEAYARYLRHEFMSLDDMSDDVLIEHHEGYGPRQRLRDFLWCAARPDWVAGKGAVGLYDYTTEERADIMGQGPAPLDDLIDNFERALPSVTERIGNEVAVLIPADLRHLNDPRLVPWLDGILADQIVEFMTPREVKTAA